MSYAVEFYTLPFVCYSLQRKIAASDFPLLSDDKKPIKQKFYDEQGLSPALYSSGAFEFCSTDDEKRLSEWRSLQARSFSPPLSSSS